MSTSKKEIREELKKIKEGKDTGKELVFDIKTGDLIIRTKQKPNADTMVLDQIAEDGFM